MELNIALIFVLLVVVSFGLVKQVRGHVYAGFVDVLSWIINAYLIRRYPIKSLDGSRSIPTCPYRWPNGHGDVGKFLEGEKNSKQWAENHGYIYRIWSGFHGEIVVSHPEDIQAIFSDSDKHFKAINNDSGWLMGELLGKCLGLISGTAWRRVHAVTVAPFTHKSSLTYIPQATRIIKEHFDDLKEKGNIKSGVINPVDDLRLLPFWIMAEILYGKLTPVQQQELSDIIPIRESLFRKMIQGGATRFAWLRFFNTETNRCLKKFKQRWAKFHIDLYQDSQRLGNQKSAVLGMYEAVKDGQITLDQLLQTLDEMLFANLDVTMGSLSWNLLFLAKDQAVQDQIREELRTAPSRDDYIKSPSTLLAAAILESGRLKPLAAFSVPQAAPTARIAGDFLIPGGTNFVVDTHSLNIRSQFWGDGDQFRPYRFLELKASRLRYRYWRYGFGPRQCLGKHVVELIIRNIVTHLLTEHRLSLLETSHWNRSTDTWISHPDTTIGCVGLSSSRSFTRTA